MNSLIGNSANAKKQLDKFRTYASLIRSIPIDNEGLIQKEFEKALSDSKKQAEIDTREVLTRMDKLGQGPDPK